jgi:hypothetical protein
LHDDRRIRIQIQEAQKHVDPVDPDPEHCFSDSTPTVLLTEEKDGDGEEGGEWVK